MSAEPASTVTVADWNSDGIPDLVVTDAYIHVLLGKGQEQFAPAMDCGLGPGLAGLAPPAPILADFDRDGTVDLVSGNTVLFGMHDCNATRLATYPAGYNRAKPLTAADLNGDGVPDIAFSSDDGTRGLPSIGYLPPTVMATSVPPSFSETSGIPRTHYRATIPTHTPQMSTAMVVSTSSSPTRAASSCSSTRACRVATDTLPLARASGGRLRLCAGLRASPVAIVSRKILHFAIPVGG